MVKWTKVNINNFDVIVNKLKQLWYTSCNYSTWKKAIIEDNQHDFIKLDWDSIYLSKLKRYKEYEELLIHTLQVWDIVTYGINGKTEYVVLSIDKFYCNIKQLSTWKIYTPKKDKLVSIPKTNIHYNYCLKNCNFVLSSEWWKEWVKNNMWESVKTFCNYIDNSFSEDSLRNWLVVSYDTNKSSKEEIGNDYININVIDYNKYHFNPVLKFTDWVNTYINKKYLIPNNNTMNNLNEIRAKKYFSTEKNLEAIEALTDTLDTISETLWNVRQEVTEVDKKILSIKDMLNDAVENNNLKTVKELVKSIKKIESFVNELNKKTIWSFAPVETEFDIDSLLK